MIVSVFSPVSIRVSDKSRLSGTIVMDFEVRCVSEIPKDLLYSFDVLICGFLHILREMRDCLCDVRARSNHKIYEAFDYLLIVCPLGGVGLIAFSFFFKVDAFR